MIPTAPSDRIKDFLDFFARAFGKDARQCAAGASDEEVARFAGLCRFPLPTLYVDYLRFFGRNDGGLRLTGDADSRIGELIDFYACQAQRNYALIPPRTVIFGLETLSGGRALYYPERPQQSEPLVVRTWDETIGVIWAKCFRNYLYSRAYGASLFPHGTFCDASLHAVDKGLTESLRAFAEANGFTSYWFSDEYHACLERQGISLSIGQAEDGTTVFIKCSDERVKDDLVRLFIGSFHMRDVSPGKKPTK